jgi:hypothetical protein
MKPCASLTAIALLVSGWAHGQGAEPVAVLGQPGLAGRFLMLRDGSVRVGSDGPVLSEALEQPGDVAVSWLEPGVRVAKSVREAGGVELTTLSGAAGHGQVGKESLWLFRSVHLTNRGKAKRAATLQVTLSRGGLALRDDVALLDGDNVLLLVSREPNEVRAGGAGETLAAFDFALPPRGTGDLLLAVPAQPTAYPAHDLPDVRNADPGFELGKVTEWWQNRVLPDRFALGSELVTDAFHAAVDTLLIEPPAADDLAGLATALSALSRAGHGPEVSQAVEALVAGQREDGGFAGVTDIGLQADLTTALADCALFSEAPERWTSLLWRPISRSADALAKPEPPPALAARVALALQRAGDVADALGETDRAEELHKGTEVLLAGSREPTSPPTSVFEARAQALVIGLRTAQPPSLGEQAPLTDLLAAAYVAVLSGDAPARQRAWEAVVAQLAAQPLPGVRMDGSREDTHVAAQLIFLAADSVARADGGQLHLLPALPEAWRAEGRLALLDGFPSGLGPLRVDLRSADAGTTTLSVDKVPKLAQQVLVSPPLGMNVEGVRANGKPMPREAFEAGPPWALDRSVRSVAFSSGRP